MQKKTKVELGIIGVCAALLGGSTIAVNAANKDKAESTVPAPSSSYVEQTTTAPDDDDFDEIVVPATSSTAQSTVTTTTSTSAEPVPEEAAVSTTTSSEKKVYIAASGEGTKYHRRSNCGSMTDSIESR